MVTSDGVSAKVHRWRCPVCPFTVWAPRREAVADELATHLGGHYIDTARETVFRTRWTCPTCEESVTAPSRGQLGNQIESHVVEHERPRIVADADIGIGRRRSRSYLTLTPDNAVRNFARVHLAGGRESVVFVTTEPHNRLALAEAHLGELIDHVVLVVPRGTTRQHVAATERMDCNLDVDLHTAEGSLDDIGSTISSVLHQAVDDPLVDFGLFEPIIEGCNGDQAFRFTHLLLGVIETSGATAHFALDPARLPEPTIRTYVPLFDRTVAARDDRFVSVVSEPNRTITQSTSASAPSDWASV